MEERRIKSRQRDPGKIAVNLLGVLCALAVGFGGLYAVQGRLGLEQERLLAGGGMVELPQADGAETAETESVSVSGPLTEEKLLQILESRKEQGEAVPHEPLPGQINMAQAIDYGREWLEESVLPYLEPEAISAGEYKTSCYLWAPESVGEDLEASPWMSSWTVSLNSSGVDALLTLNAVNGQVLEASISFSSPVSYRGEEGLCALLEVYAESFGGNEDYCLICSKETDTGAKSYYQSIGTRGLYAAIETDNVVMSFAPNGPSETVPDNAPNVYVYTGCVNIHFIHFYLCTEPEQHLQD